MGVWLGVTGLVALYARHVCRRPARHLTLAPGGALDLAVLGAWMVVTVACVAGCAASAAAALRRARLEVSRLAMSTVVARVVAIGIAVQATVSVVCLVTLRALRAGGIDARDAVFSTGSVVDRRGRDRRSPRCR